MSLTIQSILLKGMFNCPLIPLNSWKHNRPPNPYTSQTASYLEKTVLQISIKSNVIQTLRKNVNMMTIFVIFISSLLTTSSFKSVLWTYNLIRTLTSILDTIFSMKTYRTVHDSICPFISKNFLPSAFLFIIQKSENVSSITITYRAHHINVNMGYSRHAKPVVL